MALFTLSPVGLQEPVRVPVPEVAQLSIGIKPTKKGIMEQDTKLYSCFLNKDLTFSFCSEA